MKRLIVLSIVAAGCSEIPTGEEAMPELPQEVVIFDKPIAGGAVTCKLEFAPLGIVYAEDILEELTANGGPDFHGEAQIRYAAPILGGRAAGDFVPYLDVQMAIENLETGARWEGALLPGSGLMDGWHYMADVDLDGTIGLSSAGYQAEVDMRLGEGVILHEDVLEARDGTFLGSEPIHVEGPFTLEDLASPPAEEEGSAAETEEPAPGMGYGY
ncbi:MAG: iron transporter [Deltaproteobacteria bacterium]|nr:iron transporter [Deltaproteobacteria bacterium]